jgi:hypothetical protein
MAKYIHIMVNTDENLEEFAQQVSSLLGLSLEFRHDQYDEWFTGVSPNFHIDLGVHDYDNDHDMLFENYRYDVTIRPSKIVTSEDWQNAIEFVKANVYEKLKATGRYSLMLTEQLGKKLDEYEPTTPAVQVGARR